jgi:hypothetical protein
VDLLAVEHFPKQVQMADYNIGTGESVLNDFKNGKLTPTTQSNVSSHFGLK